MFSYHLFPAALAVADLATAVAWPDDKLPSHTAVAHGDGQHSLEASRPHHNVVLTCSLSNNVIQ